MLARVLLRLWQFGIVVGVIMAIGGCASPAARNEPLQDDQDEIEARAPLRGTLRADMTYWSYAGEQKPFIGVALSGGGSRAAVFGWAVLQQLHAAGLLDDLDAVSSVSGGSLAAGLFALNSDRLQTPDDWQAQGYRLRYDFLSDWLQRIASPAHWVRNAFTGQTRTLMMAEVFDEVLFGGARYADLGEPGPQRPQLFINATRSSDPTVSRAFVFDNGDFEGRLGSRLDSYPISHAVIASGAFPGVFGNVALRNYREKLLHPDTGEPMARPLYEQLYDGGPSDNLGVWTLIHRARERYKASVRHGQPMQGCLIVLIDAYAAHPTRQLSMLDVDADESIIDWVIKPTAWDSMDALLYANRVRTLQALGFKNGDTQGERDGDRFVPMPTAEQVPRGRLTVGADWARVYDPVVSVPLFGPHLPWQEATLWAGPEGAEIDTHGLSDAEAAIIHRQRLARTRDLEKRAPQCMLWHLSFDRLGSLSDYTFTDGTHIQLQPLPSTEVFRTDVKLKTTNDGLGSVQTTSRQVVATDPIGDLARGHQVEVVNVIGFRRSLAALTGRTDTSYRLVGPLGCSSDFIGDALQLSAKILVNEDQWARDRVCTWYRQHGLSPACDVAAPSKSILDLPQPWFSSIVRSTRGREIAFFMCRPAPSGDEFERAFRRLEAR
jgi:predicted acylesterase/phospholipase RssA